MVLERRSANVETRFLLWLCLATLTLRKKNTGKFPFQTESNNQCFFLFCFVLYFFWGGVSFGDYFSRLKRYWFSVIAVSFLLKESPSFGISVNTACYAKTHNKNRSDERFNHRPRFYWLNRRRLSNTVCKCIVNCVCYSASLYTEKENRSRVIMRIGKVEPERWPVRSIWTEL